MEISKNDTFNVNLCMRGLGVLVTTMHSDIYEFIYHLTFKKSMKIYANDFKKPFEDIITHDEFFSKIDDPYVQNFMIPMNKLIEFKLEIMLRFGIDEAEDLEDDFILSQSKFKPYRLVFKRSKSYSKLLTYYDRSLSSTINCLSLYACALTAKSYKIPMVLKAQLKQPGMDNLHLLNRDDHNVELLLDLIAELKTSLEAFRTLYLLGRKAFKI